MSEHDPDRPIRHAKTRRLKRILRYTPRRAVFHRYPLVGRFAVLARRRAHLWSLKPQYVRRGIYLGCVLSLWPLMGIQLVVAFVVSLIMRGNFMVAGGLQFITNPLTAAPIYYATYRVGRFVLTRTGFAGNGAAVPPDAVALAAPSAEVLPHQLHLPSAFGTAVTALFVGGALCGLALGVVLDLLYRLGWNFEHRPRKRAGIRP